MELNEINDKTKEGRLLMMAVAALTVSPSVKVGGEEFDGRKTTPMDMLDRIKAVADDVYKDQPVEPFEAASRSLIQYLAENHHPHVTAIVTNDSAQLLEGQRSVHVPEYIKD
jgi:hypothetical protein